MSGASCQYSTEIGVESFKSSPFPLLLFLLLMSFPPISQHLYQKYIRCNEVSHIWIIRSIGKVKSGYVGFWWETCLLSQNMFSVQLSPFLSWSCQPCPLIIHPLQSSPLHPSHQSSKVLNQPSKCPSHLIKQMFFRYFFRNGSLPSSEPVAVKMFDAHIFLWARSQNIQSSTHHLNKSLSKCWR